MTRRSRVRGIVPTRAEGAAALLSAGLFAIAFPPFALVLPALICLAPVTVLVCRYADRDDHAWSAARIGFWFGFIGYGANLYWIAVALRLYTDLAILGYVASLIWLAPFVGATFAALFFARRVTGWPLAILLPIVWTASELALNYLGDLAFPWLPLGLAAAHYPILAQVADLSGVRGVSFWIAAVNGAIADAWLLRADMKRMLRRGVIALGIIACALGYGAWRMGTIKLEPLARISIVQPDIPEEAKLKLDDRTAHVGKLAEMTREELAGSPSQLVVWPEAALDGFMWDNPSWTDSLRTAVAEHPTPMIVGFLDSSDPSVPPTVAPFRYYNAALSTNELGIPNGATYRKHFLVPIVERVPFVNPDWFRGMAYFGAFGRGTTEIPFSFAFGNAGVLICYESVFPQLSRTYARAGVAVLVNITNDAWFQRSSAPYQHFAHLSLRAIENRLPVVRAANTGISGWIDPLGRVRVSTDIFVPATATYLIERAQAHTLYTLVGDWVGGLCAAVTAAFLLAAWRQRRRQPVVGDSGLPAGAGPA